MNACVHLNAYQKKVANSKHKTDKMVKPMPLIRLRMHRTVLTHALWDFDYNNCV